VLIENDEIAQIVWGGFFEPHFYAASNVAGFNPGVENNTGIWTDDVRHDYGSTGRWYSGRLQPITVCHFYNLKYSGSVDPNGDGDYSQLYKNVETIEKHIAFLEWLAGDKDTYECVWSYELGTNDEYWKWIQ
jgi:hypothetical protein